jgi:hypothetical protein
VSAVVVDVLTLIGKDAALSAFGIPFCESASVACAIWVFLVVHCWPFAIHERHSGCEGEKACR